MKKIMILLAFMILLFTSCKSQKMTDAKQELKYGDKTSFSFVYGDKTCYDLGANVLFASVSGESIITTVNIYYDKSGNVISSENVRSIVLKSSKTTQIYFRTTYSDYLDESTLTYKQYVSKKEVFALFEGADIYYEVL